MALPRRACGSNDAGANPVRWQAQSSKLLNVLLVVGRFDFDWFPPVRSKSVISDVLGYTE
jgi:hypothetical protein